MIKMISVKEAARQWNITERRVAELAEVEESREL